METSNKLIAQFMGIVKEDDSYSSGKSIEYKKGAFVDFEAAVEGSWLDYHSSWDWLMPVVWKIESFGYNVAILTGNTNIGEKLGKLKISQWQEGSKMENTYKAVVEFIKWHNNPLVN